MWLCRTARNTSAATSGIHWRNITSKGRSRRRIDRLYPKSSQKLLIGFVHEKHYIKQHIVIHSNANFLCCLILFWCSLKTVYWLQTNLEGCSCGQRHRAGCGCLSDSTIGYSIMKTFHFLLKNYGHNVQEFQDRYVFHFEMNGFNCYFMKKTCLLSPNPLLADLLFTLTNISAVIILHAPGTVIKSAVAMLRAR